MKIQANDPEILSLMKITDRDGNIVPWSYNSFPDGQVQIKVESAIIDNIQNSPSYYPVNVKVSIPNPIILDLFNQFKESISINNLTVNYLYGARCDKNCAGDYYVSNVASMMVKQLETVGIRTEFLAPHCYGLINPAKVNFVLPSCVKLSEYDCVVFPDESAYKRFGDQLGGCQFTICEKHRNQETGEIISHKIPNLPDNVKKIILLDDLVDAGGSFMSIANTLPDTIQADLFVFHGVFTNNALPRLLSKFDKVIVTNSLSAPEKQKAQLSDADKDRVVILNVW